jgi:hypothetical protein
VFDVVVVVDDKKQKNSAHSQSKCSQYCSQKKAEKKPIDTGNIEI